MTELTETLYNKDDELDTIVGFLTGSNALDGVWFGDSPEGKPKYWWRSKLKKAISEYGDQRELELVKQVRHDMTHLPHHYVVLKYDGILKTLTPKKEKE